MGDGARIGLGALAAVYAAINLAATTAGVRLATSDDVDILRELNDAGLSSSNLLLDLSIGRFFAPWKFRFLSRVLALDSAWMVIGLRTIWVLMPAAACAWFAAVALKSRDAGCLVGLLLAATHPVSVGYQPLLSNPQLLVGLTLVLIACVCVLNVARGRWPCWANSAALFLYATALIMQENFVVFLAVIVWAKLAFRQNPASWKDQIGFIAPYLFVTAAYVSIYGLLRAYAAALGMSYEGAQLRFDLFAFCNALVRYTLSAFPGFGCVSNLLSSPSHDPFAIWPHLETWLRTNLRWQDLTGGLLSGAAVAGLAHRLKQLSPFRLGRFASAATFALVFSPNLLIALTPKYQVWALQRRYPYYYPIARS